LGKAFKKNQKIVDTAPQIAHSRLAHSNTTHTTHMRTKALILAAALGAAGVATSMAQVYSVNYVGYVNQTIPHSFSMIANPFVTPSNTLNALFPPASMPPGLSFYKFTGGGFQISSIDEFDVIWVRNGLPVGDTETLEFGGGAFLYNPGSTFTNTWVGEGAQGLVSNPAPTGFSIKSSKIPQQGLVTTDLGFTPTAGDTIQKFNSGSQSFQSYNFDEFDLIWVRDGVPSEPSLGIAESAFFNLVAPNNWNRNFTVN